MRLRTYGALLDVALLATTGYLLSSSPLVTHLRSAPGGALAGLRTLADGAPYARSLSGAAVAGGEAPSSTKWADFLLGDNLGALASSSRSGDPARFHELDGWLNSWVLPEAVRASLPHVLAIWLRNCLAGWALYFIVGGMWAAVIYGPWRARFFGSGGGPPPWDDMMLQVQVSTQAMLLYSLMPTLGEWLMERGWTHAYLDWPQMEPLSIARYLGGIAAYVFLVEWGIYWMHRYLHDNRFLYKLLHRTHHIYNNNLSPFAGLAFHPIDGMLQASPYIFFLFALPVHFWAHMGLLFFTAVWTTNIHDTITCDSEPIMGAGYHTLHHTTYKDNYGQFFVFFDWVHETLLPPKHRREQGWCAGKGEKKE